MKQEDLILKETRRKYFKIFVYDPPTAIVFFSNPSYFPINQI